MEKQAADDSAATPPASLTSPPAQGTNPPAETPPGSEAGSASAASATAGAPEADSAVNAWAKLDDKDQKHWQDVITRNISSHVRFIVEGRTQQGTAHAIANCTLANLRSDTAGTILFHYDVKKAGESASRPEFKHPPHKQELYAKLVRGVLTGRSTAEKGAHLAAGELALIISPKEGLDRGLIEPWRVGTQKDGKAVAKDRDDMDVDEEAAEDEEQEDDSLPGFSDTHLIISYTQDSLKNKRLRVARDRVGLLRQTEKMHVLSEAPLRLPERQRKHYPGTSCGDLISGVVMPDPATEVMIQWGQKKKAFQKNRRSGRQSEARR